MPYIYTKRINLIWFGPLPFENQQRLRQLRTANPLAEINVLFDPTILKDNEKQTIKNVASVCGAQLITLETLEMVVTQNTDKNDAKLMALVHKAKNDPFGNWGEVSDLIRVMTAFWQCCGGPGVYIDFDRPIVFAGLPEWKAVKAPMAS